MNLQAEVQELRTSTKIAEERKKLQEKEQNRMEEVLKEKLEKLANESFDAKEKFEGKIKELQEKLNMKEDLL